MFGLSRKDLIRLCHDLGTMLDAGLPVTRALSVLCEQSPASRLGRIAARATGRVNAGESLAEAFEHSGPFPPLLIQLVDAGERSGTLERTLRELQRYFEFRRRTWRSFLAQIALPVLQYVVAIAVVAFVSYILGMLTGQRRFGGPTVVLAVGYGGPLVLIAAYVAASNLLGALRLFHEAALQLPVVGYVMRSMALARFSLVLYLMYEAGLPIGEALRRSFDATGNRAFAARGRRVAKAVGEGATLAEAIGESRLFPAQYTHIIEIAEQSGKLSERLDWLARHHAARAEESLSVLGKALGWLVWAGVAAVIIYFIVSIFMGYVSAIQGAMG